MNVTNVINEVKADAKSYKNALISWGIFTAVFLIAAIYMSTNHHFPTDHIGAVAGNSNYPEGYVLHISPALAWDYGWGFWRFLGILIWFAGGIALALASKDYNIPFVSKRPVLTFVIVLVLTGFMVFQKSSKLVAGNYNVPLSPTQYENVKDNQDSLEALFPKEHVY